MFLFLAILLISTLLAAEPKTAHGLKAPKSETGNSQVQLEKTYGVIIDCGSSGSRAHIFQWDSWLRYPELLNNIEPVRDSKGEPISKKIHPGLSSLMYNPEQAFEYLKPIIDFVEESIPKKSLKATSIYVLATAGMRLLDSETQLEIMNDLVEDFKSENSFASFKTSVISGASEGMYQWITVNSKAKRFKDNQPKVSGVLVMQPEKSTNSSKNNNNNNGGQQELSDKTYGLIEMGGASIQVTYQLTDRMKQRMRKQLTSGKSQELFRTFKEQIIEPKISREAEEYNYKLVSTTFLGFGSNSARLTYVDLLVNKHVRDDVKKRNQIHIGLYTRQKPLNLKDPCIPVGSSESVTRPTRILSLPENALKTVGFNMVEDDVLFSVQLEGSGNYEQCYQFLSEMLARSKSEKLNCKPEERGCTMSLIGEKFIPFNEYEFLGLGDFYYTTKEMIEKPGKYDKSAIVEKTKEICATPFKKLLILYPKANRFDKSRVLRECFKAVWIDVFLSQALNMPNNYQNFNTVGDINGDEINWTLGAVLDNSLSMEIAAENEIHGNPDDDGLDDENEFL